MPESIEDLKRLHAAATLASKGGPPQRTSNPFFGVGPISDGAADEVVARRNRHDFEHWLEETYRKRDDKGRDLGPYTLPELARSMHRGEPADSILRDMMRAIHRYFGLPRSNRLAIGLGGGHAGFTMAALHFVSGSDLRQKIYVDTPRPETEAAATAGFFRQSWATQLLELLGGGWEAHEQRLVFAEQEGTIPPANDLVAAGIRLFVGVGHETTGATTYTKEEVQNLLNWLDADPTHHHAVIDATSLLGAMPWGADIAAKLTTKCCFFMPLQKAIGGVSGYTLLSLTPQALTLAERNAADPLVPIPRQLKLVVPVNQKRALTGRHSIHLGPLYDAHDDRMLGGVINTFSCLAIAETTFALQRQSKTIGLLSALNQRSLANRAAVDRWLHKQLLFDHAVLLPERRGAAVTLLKAVDFDIKDRGLHDRIVVRTKQLMGLEGVTHVDGSHEAGLDVARYINAFPGTPGDFRAWIGGVREEADILALLENLTYCWHRAKAAVAAEELFRLGITLKAGAKQRGEAISFATARVAAEEVTAILAGLDTISHPLLQKKAITRHRKALVAASAAIQAELSKIIGTKPARKAPAKRKTKPKAKSKPAVKRSRSISRSGKPKTRPRRSGKRL